MKLSLAQALSALAAGPCAVQATSWTYWPTDDPTPKPTGPTASPSPTDVPTLKPTSPCTGSTDGWADSYGDGCEWYEAADRPGCPMFGDMYEGEMGVANDNCCYCFGTGAPVAPTPFPTPYPSISKAPSTPYPTYPPFPTYPPTVSHSPSTSPSPTDVPTPKPTASCSGSTEGWADSYGDGCDWYEMADPEGCPNYGAAWEGEMGVANENCCWCFGTGAPTPEQPYPPFPTYPPTISRSPTTSPYPTDVPTPKPSSPCDDNTEGWLDAAGDDCTWYEGHDEPGCPHFGYSYEGAMGVAKDNCCYCNMDI